MQSKSLIKQLFLFFLVFMASFNSFAESDYPTRLFEEKVDLYLEEEISFEVFLRSFDGSKTEMMAKLKTLSSKLDKANLSGEHKRRLISDISTHLIRKKQISRFLRSSLFTLIVVTTAASISNVTDLFVDLESLYTFLSNDLNNIDSMSAAIQTNPLMYILTYAVISKKLKNNDRLEILNSLKPEASFCKSILN